MSRVILRELVVKRLRRLVRVRFVDLFELDQRRRVRAAGSPGKVIAR